MAKADQKQMLQRRALKDRARMAVMAIDAEQYPEACDHLAKALDDCKRMASEVAPAQPPAEQQKLGV